MTKSHSLRLLLLCTGTFLSFLYAFSGEFLVRDETYEITDRLIIERVWSGAGGPANWMSPDDYYNGQFYIRYEIISQPTDRQCMLQFVIWQDFYEGNPVWLEQAGTLVTMSGPGDVQYVNSSPNSWWRYEGNSLDFTRPGDITKLGIEVWSKSPAVRIASYLTTPDEIQAYADRYDWVPLKFRYTIVAVSAGSSFSGWSNYLDTQPPPTPDYSIDYSAETTNQVIPSTDEYSYSASMSPAYSGTWSELSLTPGEDVYFRTKATGSKPASDIQHLVVPGRPAAPGYSIDYVNERTAEAIPSTVEYSTSSGMSGASSGAGSALSITPGEDLYFRVKATGSTFGSSVFTLPVPARPAAPGFSFDFFTESTATVVSSDYIHSLSPDMSDAVTGTGAVIQLAPGTDIYFAKKATTGVFRSEIQKFSLPARPAQPTAIGIDYTEEKTSVPLGTDLEYSMAVDMSGAQTGTGVAVSLQPGTDLYIRKKATVSSFRSDILQLVVPDRPEVISLTIDYTGERTHETLSAEYKYSANSDLSAAFDSKGSILDLTPGEDIYYQKNATDTNFKSLINHLLVPARPAAPVFTIDYVEELTFEEVDTAILIADNEMMSDSIPGTGERFKVSPGTNLYFQHAASEADFASGISHLPVPLRPFFTNDYDNGKTSESPIVVTLNHMGLIEPLTESNLQITNAVLSDVIDNKYFEINPESYGIVSVKLLANAFSAGNFASEAMEIEYIEPTFIDGKPSPDGIAFFPNPTQGMVRFEVNDGSSAYYDIAVFDKTGRKLKEMKISGESPSYNIDLSDLQPGLYIIRISDDKGAISSRKVIIAN